MMTDFEIVQSQARINNRPIMLIFSGSDWCSWCVKLEQEVFSQPEFKAWAQDHVIPLQVDFPRRTALSPELQKQNDSLARQYRVEGFPTVLLLDADGKELARTGYQAGGAANYIQHLTGLLR